MVRIKHTAASRRDLIEIWKYAAADNEDAADSLLDSIEEMLKLLSQSPLPGRTRKELSRDIRSFPVGNYVIFYVPHKDGITVVRVLSGYRDLDALFRR